jgi:hypothetical protein
MDGLAKLRSLTRRQPEDEEVEMLDLEALRSRIGEPVAKRPPAQPQADLLRSDRAQPSERSWRRIAGLSR